MIYRKQEAGRHQGAEAGHQGRRGAAEGACAPQAGAMVGVPAQAHEGARGDPASAAAGPGVPGLLPTYDGPELHQQCKTYGYADCIDSRPQM